MAVQTRREFPPSLRAAPAASAQHLGKVPSRQRIEISLYLKPRKRRPAGWIACGNARRDLKSKRKLQHAGDIKQVRAFAREHQLDIVAVEPERRRIRLGGSAARMQAAFGVELARYREGGKTFHACCGAPSLPRHLHGIVESVLGLDARPIAQPHFIVHPHAASASPHLPNAVAALYGFPASATGAGQCIALIELGGGFNASDTRTAFKAMGLTPPKIVAVPVDGGRNKPRPDDGANGEVALDIQVCGGVAPGAAIAVYFAANTDAGFVDAISHAVHDAANKPSVVSISWGAVESAWTQQALDSMNGALQDAAALGVSVFVASGDNLATDGVDDGHAHVDFPASSPWAIGCGGTVIDVANDAITSESVWNDGVSGDGGGISDVFAVPNFQRDTKLPPSVNDGKQRRGVPDVAGNAAPDSGYRIVVAGENQVIGGTSAVAPLWAGLAALVNERAAKPVGFFLSKLYAHGTWLREITRGDNNRNGGKIGYAAGAGWNACTGLGVPDGQALFAGLGGRSARPGKSRAGARRTHAK